MVEFDPDREAFLLSTQEAVSRETMTVALTLVNNTPGSRSGRGSTYIFQAVGDIEVTDSVELSTEPGVMGRIGPKFPRSATFRVRVHDNPQQRPRKSGLFTPSTARQQHNLLRNLVGTLLWIDARATPMERITWTIENVKALDDNSAKNAYDVEVSAREILGGEFGEFIDPDELSTESGLVPLAIDDTTAPTATGIGNGVYPIALEQFMIPSGNESGLPVNQPSANELVSFNDNLNLPPNERRFARNNRASEAFLQKLKDFGLKEVSAREYMRISGLAGINNHAVAFGAGLPEIVNCTHGFLKFNVMGADFTVEFDATTALSMLTVTVESPILGHMVRILKPGTAIYIPGAGKDFFKPGDVGNVRTDIGYPTAMDCSMILAPDGGPATSVFDFTDVNEFHDFNVENFSHYNIFLIFSGGIVK